jgi:hypothetical protein
MRMTLCVATALVLLPAAIPGGDRAPRQSLDDDWKALTASSWINEKPEAAWSKLSEVQKKAYGGKGWQRVEARFWEDPDPLKLIPPGGSKHKVDIGFLAVGKAEAYPRWGRLPLTLQQDKGARYFVLKGQAGVLYKVSYSFKDGKLALQGTYFSLNPQISTPTVFDGEFTPVKVKKP